MVERACCFTRRKEKRCTAPGMRLLACRPGRMQFACMKEKKERHVPVRRAAFDLQEPGKALKALVWQNGPYGLRGNKTSQWPGAVTGCSETGIAGPWKVKFPAGYGAPPEIVLASLISLHKHP